MKKDVFFVLKRSPSSQECQQINQLINGHFNAVSYPNEAEAILVFGGDGTMLTAIRELYHYKKPFYGLNFGHLGFLMNEANDLVINELITNQCEHLDLRLLEAYVYNQEKKLMTIVHAFNDCYFERSDVQTAKLKIWVDGELIFDPLTCDGVIVATPAGSTAYNASAHGQIVPIESNLMALTGICPAVYHRWTSSLLSPRSKVAIETTEITKRPVRFLADGVQIANAHSVTIQYSDQTVRVGFANSSQFTQRVKRVSFSLPLK